ncbi:hypothetical protein CKF54_04415 [Psittacicella hinzii]|uniref:Secreted protein n=1 Tax=Psittacicella hinzii TaxID=2028575 RepID=A0A3A1Y395_9GAMM|nr:hypothetical protein [Psittacicella hinzii]RIY32703.1 hypothetical protein CKF54_04415 [Psittacicella hinzii]
MKLKKLFALSTLAVAIPTLAFASATSQTANYSSNKFFGDYTANEAVASYIEGNSYRLPLPGVGAYEQVTRALFDLAKDDDFYSVEDKAEHFEDVFVTFYVVSKVAAQTQDNKLGFDASQVTLNSYLRDLTAACNTGQLTVNRSAVNNNLSVSLTSKEARKVNGYARDFENLCTLSEQYTSLINLPEFKSYLALYSEYAEHVYQVYRQQAGTYGVNLTYDNLTDDFIEDQAKLQFRQANPRGYRLLKDFDNYAVETRAIYRALS